jgi:selenocysteine-specific elongation factor
MPPQKDRHIIIGTAGHVDHGKTALIRALTGVETDRLKEEKLRGISISLGFAPFHLPGGELVGVVDVPGHERFIHQMLAGIGGMDLVLLVVDVNEGVMPQTHEHLQIMELLQIPHGIVILTKCDLAEDDWIDMVEEEVREEVFGTFLEKAHFCRVSAVTGEGLPELLNVIQENVAKIPQKDAEGPLRLPIDRHFTIAGFGTVVTGTLLSGTVRPGDIVEILPPGIESRVREVQVHDKKVDAASAGQRVALNLAGIDRGKLLRGSVVSTPGFFEQTERLDVRLTLLADAPRPLRFRDPVHFYLGTARVTGAVALLDRDEMKQGESAIVQIHLDRPLVAHREDRFIIRSYSPMTTIGGGKILDPRPEKHRRFRQEVMKALAEMESGEKSFLLQKLTQKRFANQKELELLSGLGREKVSGILKVLEKAGQVASLANQWTTVETLRSCRHCLVETTERFHAANPLIPGVPRATLKGSLPAEISQKAYDQLLENTLAEGSLVQQGEWLKIPNFTPTPTETQAKDIGRIEQAYREAGLLAENRNGMLEKLGMEPSLAQIYFAYLLGVGRLVKLSEESYFYIDAYRQAIRALKEHFQQQQTLTAAQFRDRINSARRQTIALLEHFDALKYTRRVGDERIAWQLPEE